MNESTNASEETRLAILDHSVILGTVRAESPTDVVDVATKIANKLADVIESKELYVLVNGKKFPKCEAWTTCAAMLGISAKEKSVRLDENDDYEAVVELIDAQGNVVGGASAVCGSDEPMWKNRHRFARRSMSVTRATSKACRLKLSWILVLAGYQATPGEEMTGVENGPESKNAFQQTKRTMQGDWRDVKIHFGKNTGRPLGELNSRQLDWYADEWVTKKVESEREPSEDDRTLVDALLLYKRERKPPMTAKQFAEAREERREATEADILDWDNQAGGPS